MRRLLRRRMKWSNTRITKRRNMMKEPLKDDTEKENSFRRILLTRKLERLIKRKGMTGQVRENPNHRTY